MNADSRNPDTRDIVFIGLSLSSSWGNGHATTYRSLLRGLAALGHRLTFLERDVPWYAANRDLPDPDFCALHYYRSVGDLTAHHGLLLATADAVVVGSYTPEGIAVIDAVEPLVAGAFCFYDIDTPVTLAALEHIPFRSDRSERQGYAQAFESGATSCRSDDPVRSESALAAGACDYLARRQIPAFDLYFSFSGGPNLDRLEREFGARRAEALYCSVDPLRYAATSEPVRWDLGYLGTYSEDRQPALERLLIEPARRMPGHRFVVAGPQYPDTIDWPANVERIDHLAPDEHAAFYSRQRFTLSVTRRDMVAAGWSPSVRLFEAAACGVPIVTDPWPGVADFFPPGRAIHVAERTEDVCALLAGDDETGRRAVAAAAREIVASAHTGAARARDFLSALVPPSSPAESHAAA